MPKVAVAAKITAKPGQRDALVQAFKPMLDHVETEAGTELYFLTKDTKDPDVVWFWELYADQDALSAHGTSDKMKEVGASLGEFMAGRAELMFLEPVGGKGVSVIS
jgi:quinol monooxygenase YgiN